MSDITFTDPPAATRGKLWGRHQQIAEALRERPGDWALVMEGVNGSNSHSIRTARIKAYAPAGAYEATARKNGDRHDIYARYVGGE